MTKTKQTNKGETVVYTCKALACDAGGPEEDGGHVFDLDGSDERRSTAACRCGMDQMTYDAFIKYASWR